MSDADMRQMVADFPAPQFEHVAFTSPPPLVDATVALVTTAGLMRPTDEWVPQEENVGFWALGRDERDLVVAHESVNFDRVGIAADRNVAYPIDRLEELAADGVIGAVAPRHLSFTGPIIDLSTVAVDSGPAAAAVLRDDGVDVVLLAPVCPLCTRTVSTVAHALEAGGLATVTLSLVRPQVERARPPRALHCEFPLGRPLGRPGDAAFQRRVLDAAFGLLDRPSGPVLEDFPETIADEAEHPLTCPLPPRFDPDLPAAVDEARALRPAWERARSATGGSQVGRIVDADGVPDAIDAFVRIADGVAWESAGLPGDPAAVAMDVRAYYEEAALALADHVPAARAAESWLYRTTETGAVLKAAAAQMAQADPPYPRIFYLVPMSQQ